MTNKNRILLIAAVPFYEDRGTPIAVRNVLEALSSLGYSVDMLVFPQGQNISLPGLTLVRVRNLLGIRSVPIGLSIRKMFLETFVIAKLHETLRHQSYDCIHAVEEVAFGAVLLARKYGIPVVYDMQSSLPEQLASKKIFRLSMVYKLLLRCERWLVREADVIACSAGLEDHVHEIDPGANVRPWLFPPARVEQTGAEVARLRQNLHLVPGARVVLYLGNFEPYQGLDRLCDAMAIVRKDISKAVLVLIGSKPPDAHLHTPKARKLLESNGLRVIPRMEREQATRHLGVADVLVSPRDPNRNLPLKVLDYMISGKPIVATDCPTHRTVLSDQRAILVEPTATAMASGIARLLRDQEMAKRLAAAAMAYAEEHLQWESFTTCVKNLVDAACATAGRGRTAGIG